MFVIKIFVFVSCISGYLVEINERLQDNVGLLKTKVHDTNSSFSDSCYCIFCCLQPLSEGYLAILNQKLSDDTLSRLQKYE